MKKIIVLSMCVIALGVTLSFVAGDRNNSFEEQLLVDNLEAMSENESDAVCIAGGIGSSACSSNASVGAEVGCSVTCNSGYYSCCNILGCKCIAN